MWLVAFVLQGTGKLADVLASAYEIAQQDGMCEEQEDVAAGGKSGEHSRRPSRQERDGSVPGAVPGSVPGVCGETDPVTQSEFTVTQEGGRRVIRHAQRMFLTDDQLQQMFPALAEFQKTSLAAGGDVKLKIPARPDAQAPENGNEFAHVKKGEGPGVQTSAPRKSKKITSSFRMKGILKNVKVTPTMGALSESDEERECCEWDEEAAEAHIDAMRQQELKYSLIRFSLLFTFYFPLREETYFRS